MGEKYEERVEVVGAPTPSIRPRPQCGYSRPFLPSEKSYNADGMAPSNLVILKHELVLIISIRCTEVLTFLVCLVTIRIIHVHSSRSIGAYKFCLYQIVILPLLAQQCAIFGPVFVFPIIGSYQYVDFTDDPHVIHAILCTWFFICALDAESVFDGFVFRLRVLLKTFHPRVATNIPWLPALLFLKVGIAIYIVVRVVPVGEQLKKDEMRIFLVNNYPNVVATFDEYKSFVVYDTQKDWGITRVAIVLGSLMILLSLCCLFVILAIFRLLGTHGSKMSTTTKRMHARFVLQLGIQGTVPFAIFICPFLAMVSLILLRFQFETNAPAYVLLLPLMLHGPLTSILTLALYDPYRRAVLNFLKSKLKVISSVDPSTSMSRIQ